MGGAACLADTPRTKRLPDWNTFFIDTREGARAEAGLKAKLVLSLWLAGRHISLTRPIQRDDGVTIDSVLRQYRGSHRYPSGDVENIHRKPLPERDADHCSTDRYRISLVDLNLTADLNVIAITPALFWKPAHSLLAVKMLHRQSGVAAAIKKLNLGSIW
jgi:hypothetical protein